MRTRKFYSHVHINEDLTNDVMLNPFEHKRAKKYKKQILYEIYYVKSN